MLGKILVVDDEPAICEVIGFALLGAGYEYETALDTREAERAVTQEVPDLILLDWMLPGRSGVEFSRWLSANESTKDVPVIMLTARGEEGDVVAGFDAGVDDYMIKPFSPRELVARVRAVLRRAAPHVSGDVLKVNDLTLDPDSHRVSAGGAELDMGPTEFRLLQFFMSHRERVYSRNQLIDLVWGQNVYIEERTVDVHIRRLREVLSRHGHDRLIQTVRGAGYRFSTRS